MTDMVDQPPPNESRVIITDNATWGFAYVKDGMFKWDGSNEWEVIERENRGLMWITVGKLKKIVGLD